MIFYFSATGNTLWAAKRLAEATQEPLVFIPDEPADMCRYTLKEGERIGFCFPVHGWRPPTLVRDFVKRLEIEPSESHFCYALCTAGDNIGETIDIFNNELAKVGLKLDSACSLVMPESYVGLPFMDVDKPEKEKAKKEHAASVLEAFTKSIVACERDVFTLVKGNWPRINSRVIGGYFHKRLITDKHFKVVSERCTKCGLCTRVCPVHNIDGGVGSEPSWKHSGACMTCFSCYHHCPHHAIEFGRQTKHKGQYYYKEPNV